MQRRPRGPHLHDLVLRMWTRRGWLSAALIGAVPRERKEYRIDATIVILGVPVFKRSGVGGGWAEVEPRLGGRLLRFAAGSWPERTRGLNRMGFVEEHASESGSTYFGFMTASGEESFAEAKRALEAAGAKDSEYTAIAGEVRRGRAECRTARFQFPAHYGWGNWRELYPLANRAFADATAGSQASRETPRQASHSFLHTLTGLMLEGEGRRTRAFVYGNREMTLTASTARDGDRLRLDGRTQLKSKTLSAFRLWYRPGSPLPERVELQVKPFLRLTLT